MDEALFRDFINLDDCIKWILSKSGEIQYKIKLDILSKYFHMLTRMNFASWDRQLDMATLDIIYLYTNSKLLNVNELIMIIEKYLYE